VLCSDQLLPSHRSASVLLAPSLPVYAPTAVHAVLAVHDTALSTAPVEPDGFGELRSVQLAASATPIPGPRAPTAKTTPKSLRNTQPNLHSPHRDGNGQNSPDLAGPTVPRTSSRVG
jgi:hypothetical protein